MNGWIKTYRKLLDWEWYGHPDMVALWIHLLLSANTTDGEWRGVQIKRGQLVTGRRELSRKTGLSERSVRTCLSRLQATHEVTIKTSHQYSIITICNFDSYQATAPTTDPTTDPQFVQQSTTNKNIRRKEEKNISIVCDVRAKLENETINNSLWLEQASMNLRSDNVLQLAMDVMNEWQLTQVPEHEWTVAHLYNHMRKKIDIQKSQTKPSAQEAKADRKAELKQIIMNNLMQMQYDNTTEHKN